MTSSHGYPCRHKFTRKLKCLRNIEDACVTDDVHMVTSIMEDKCPSVQGKWYARVFRQCLNQRAPKCLEYIMSHFDEGTFVQPFTYTYGYRSRNHYITLHFLDLMFKVEYQLSGSPVSILQKWQCLPKSYVDQVPLTAN